MSVYVEKKSDLLSLCQLISFQPINLCTQKALKKLKQIREKANT